MSFGLLGFLGALWVVALLTEFGSVQRASLPLPLTLEIALAAGLVLTMLTWPRVQPALRRVKSDRRTARRDDRYWS